MLDLKQFFYLQLREFCICLFNLFSESTCIVKLYTHPSQPISIIGVVYTYLNLCRGFLLCAGGTPGVECLVWIFNYSYISPSVCVFSVPSIGGEGCTEKENIYNPLKIYFFWNQVNLFILKFWKCFFSIFFIFKFYFYLFLKQTPRWNVTGQDVSAGSRPYFSLGFSLN